MRILSIISIASILLLSSCLSVEEEPILLIIPTAEISAHIKDKKIFATTLVNVNPQVISTGNIPILYDFTGDVSIFDINNGNIIDVNTFSGTGLSSAYTVSADTFGRDRFVIIATGTINAFADIGDDGDSSNDKLISTGDFYNEAQFIVSDLLTK